MYKLKVIKFNDDEEVRKAPRQERIKNLIATVLSGLFWIFVLNMICKENEKYAWMVLSLPVVCMFLSECVMSKLSCQYQSYQF